MTGYRHRTPKLLVLDLIRAHYHQSFLDCLGASPLLLDVELRLYDLKIRLFGSKREIAFGDSSGVHGLRPGVEVIRPILLPSGTEESPHTPLPSVGKGNGRDLLSLQKWVVIGLCKMVLFVALHLDRVLPFTAFGDPSGEQVLQGAGTDKLGGKCVYYGRESVLRR